MTVVYLGLPVELLTMGTGAFPKVLVGSSEPIPHPVLPCPVLIQRRCLVLLQPDMSCFFGTNRSPASF